LLCSKLPLISYLSQDSHPVEALRGQVLPGDHPVHDAGLLVLGGKRLYTVSKL
jgi:hypothetical protein